MNVFRQRCRKSVGRRSLSGLVLLAFLLLGVHAATSAIAAPAAAGSTGPSATATLAASGVVNKLHGTLLESMKGSKEMGYRGRYDLLAPVVVEAFDMDYMARKSVGRGWKNLGEDEKQVWMDAFARLIISNYAGQFDEYSGEHFETISEDPSIKQTVMVRTRLVLPADDDVDLTYRMRHTEDGWRIIDVYAKGTVSELALRRSEYSEVLERKGFDELLSKMNDKVAELAED